MPAAAAAATVHWPCKGPVAIGQCSSAVAAADREPAGTQDPEPWLDLLLAWLAASDGKPESRTQASRVGSCMHASGSRHMLMAYVCALLIGNLYSELLKQLLQR